MSESDLNYQRALDEYLGMTGDPVAALAAAVAEDPGFVIGHTTMAALNCLGGVPGADAVVRGPLQAAKALAGRATAREALHIAAAEAWADGEIAAAAAFWEQAVQADGSDILSLRLAHDTHFFLGDARKLRDVPLASLPAYAHGTAAHGYVLGMAAFGLEEMAEYEAAEAAGRAAVETNPADTWGIHAVAHVLEMQGRVEEGIGWLRALAPHWTEAGGLAVHQYWHLCLFLLEAGKFDEVLAIYDAHIRAVPGSMILDLVDAAALLWRLELAGCDVGGRWQALLPFWAAHETEHVLAFNDLHIALTAAGAGDRAAADRLEAAMLEYAGRHGGTNAAVTKALGLPVIAALRAFRDGDYATTANSLRPVYQNLAPLGGSNAQRDLVIQSLGIAAYKLGDVALAGDVAALRRKVKSGWPRAWANYPDAAPHH